MLVIRKLLPGCTQTDVTSLFLHDVLRIADSLGVFKVETIGGTLAFHASGSQAIVMFSSLTSHYLTFLFRLLHGSYGSPRT